MGIKGKVLKYSAAGLIGLFLLAAASCGGQHKTPVNGISGSAAVGVTGVGGAAVPAVIASTPTTLHDALAQLDALEKPEGVDAKLWSELKGALKTALACRAGTCAPPSGDSGKAVHGGPQVAALQRIVSTPPTGAANNVQDLTATRETNGDFTLSWHYRNLGDYDQNGVVGVSDITPLAQHFGETYDAQTEGDSIQSVVDGSGNGKVGIEDVTQIAMNFGVTVAKYSVRGSDAYAGPFAETTIVGVSPQVSDARKVLTMNIGASPQGYWQVVPQDAEGAQGEASNVAGISLQIRSVTPVEVKEGTVVTFSADVLGAGPFTYEWDFGGQAVPSTSTEASPKVVLTRDTGGFPASVKVSNPIGNATFPFTLSKLAREWKWEVIRSGETFSTYQLETYEDNIYAYLGRSDVIVAGGAFLYFGTPENWQVEELSYHNGRVFRLNSTGTPALIGYYGPDYFTADLCLSEKTESGWTLETIQTKPLLKDSGFEYLADDTPLVVFQYRGEESSNNNALRYAVGNGDSWEIATLDDGGGGASFGQNTETVKSKDGAIGVCYTIASDSGLGQLKYAKWDDDSQTFDIEIVDSPPSEDWGTAQFPYMSFDSESNPAIAYCTSKASDISGQPPAFLLQYANKSGDAWVTETAQSCELDFEGLQPYRVSGLAHDALGEPLILYYSGIENQPHVIWLNGATWSDCTLPETTASCYPEEVTFTEYGTPFVLFRSSSLDKEVVLARYE